MTSFQLPSALFPENAIFRAERAHQAYATKTPRRWRRWLNRTFVGLLLVLSLIHVATLLLASLTQRDPTPIVQLLGPLPTLLMVFMLFYHFSLMFKTISLGANSIAREREAQTWEMLVLTGINARQIVRGKWWATVQRQFPHYLVLGFIRAGAAAAVATSIAANIYLASAYYDSRLQLPHPLSILIALFLGVLLTVANLGFSAACGVMGSAVSKRSTMASVRGFANQVVISLAPVIASFFVFNQFYSLNSSPSVISIYSFFGLGTASISDNGFSLLLSPLYVHYQYYSSNSTIYPISPLEFDWMLQALLTLAWYALLTWFALWRAEKRAVGALATPASQTR